MALRFGKPMWDNKSDQELIDESGSPLERMFWYVAAQEGHRQEDNRQEHRPTSERGPE